MDVKSIPREQHLKVASLIMDGWSQRALIECGFSKWTAKCPGHLPRNSRALQTAIERRGKDGWRSLFLCLCAVADRMYPERSPLKCRNRNGKHRNVVRNVEDRWKARIAGARIAEESNLNYCTLAAREHTGGIRASSM
jgi:hypothetical protein